MLTEKNPENILQQYLKNSNQEKEDVPRKILKWTPEYFWLAPGTMSCIPKKSRHVTRFLGALTLTFFLSESSFDTESYRLQCSSAFLKATLHHSLCRRMKQGPTLAFTWCLYYLPMLLLLQTVKLSIFPSMWQFWAFTVWFPIHMGNMLNNPINFFFHKIQATPNFRTKSRYLFLPFFPIKHSLKCHQKVF